MRYHGFVIDKSHIDGAEYIQDGDEGLRRTGKVVLWQWSEGDDPQELVRLMDAGEIPFARFKAYDDDGELYYEGRSTMGEDPSGWYGEDMYRLDMWVMADAGAVVVKWKEPGQRKWEVVYG